VVDLTHHQIVHGQEAPVPQIHCLHRLGHGRHILARQGLEATGTGQIGGNHLSQVGQSPAQALRSTERDHGYGLGPFLAAHDLDGQLGQDGPGQNCQQQQ